MLHFRTTQWQRSKLRLNNNINDTSGRVLVFRPTSFEELPVEIVQRILSHMDFGDRQSFRATSTHFRLVHDRLVEHRVKKMFLSSSYSSSSSSSPPLFLEHFCRLIHESTVFLHRVAFPQFLGMFVCQGDLLSIRSLHSSVVGKFSHAQSIGDMSDVFEKLLLQYLCVVQSGCGSHRSRFKWLLILTLVHVLKVCGDLSTYVHSTLTLPLSLTCAELSLCHTEEETPLPVVPAARVWTAGRLDGQSVAQQRAQVAESAHPGGHSTRDGHFDAHESVVQVKIVLVNCSRPWAHSMTKESVL